MIAYNMRSIWFHCYGELLWNVLDLCDQLLIMLLLPATNENVSLLSNLILQRLKKQNLRENNISNNLESNSCD